MKLGVNERLKGKKLYREVWKPVITDKEDYTGLYEVSNLGRVRSLDRYDNRGCKRKGQIRKTKKDKGGYYRIILCKNDKQKDFLVHRLVALAFIPNPENKPHVDHINTVRDDNRAVNLRWCTRKENSNNEITLKHLSEANKGEKHPMYGKHPSEETRKKLSEAHKGKTHNEETRKKIGEANKGKTHSEETKKKLSELRKGKTHNEESKKKIGEAQWKKVVCLETGKVFNSVKEAGEIIGVFPTSISACCTGKQKTCGGFHWKYYEKTSND